MARYFLIFLLLTFCDNPLYKTEASLNHSLSYFLNKKVDVLRSMWGVEDNKIDLENNQYLYLSYFKSVNSKDEQKLKRGEYYVQNGCIFTFKVETKTFEVISYSYTGGRCYGGKAVQINSNWK